MPQAPAGEKRFKIEDVARHSAESDCWIVIKGKVYDVSGWVAEHPGGRAILALAGRDATDVFTSFHSPAAWKRLAALCIGELADEEPVPELLRDFRQLRTTLARRGLFESRKSYYAMKVIGNFAILGCSIALLAYARGSLLALTASALALGLFWQQSGWLAHDFCHHQVFRNRAYNDAVAYLLGNVCQGFSIDWWKSKHNLHHAAPNELTAAKVAVDPDIDTLPLLAWSREMLETLQGRGQRKLVRVQHYLFFPVMLFARFNWAIGSAVHAWRLSHHRAKGRLEVALIVLHYAWHFGVALAFLPLGQAALYAAISQMFSGALLAIVFVQSHNGMEVFRGPKDFVTAQLVSTRDMESTLWNDWFTGGLNYQIEHHLFPTLPRHNLDQVQEPVRELCRKHGLAYEECSMTESTRRVLRCLNEIASEA